MISGSTPTFSFPITRRMGESMILQVMVSNIEIADGFRSSTKYDTLRFFWIGPDPIHCERVPMARTTPNPTRFSSILDVPGWGCTPQDKACECLHHRWYEKSIQRYRYSADYPKGLPGGKIWCCSLLFPDPHYPEIHNSFSYLLIHKMGISPRS